ncbi:DUF3667 domain-containing protein [Flavobacterium sp.]|uniref:DUF3667 domain-containing protein n=1 Tax=Flavobacterium sp. TaxID=239 RepID=UPI0039E517C4
MEAICKNCDTSYSERYNYCPNCSQKTQLHRLSFHDIVHEAVHYFTHADKGLLQLIRDLFTKRGLVAYEYVNGRRKKYFPPLNFFLIIAAVFVFVSMQGTPQEKADVIQQHPEINKIEDPVKRQHTIAVYQRDDKAARFTSKYSNLMAMCSLPLTALIFWLFYRKNKYNYIEHLVAGIYMTGICLLVYALVIMPLSFAFGFKGEPAIGLFFLLQLIYFAVFYYGFLQKTNKWQFAKALGVSFLNLVIWAVVSGSLVRFYITSGFGGLLN